MKSQASRRREWLVATSALQRLQLTVAARRISADAERADTALRPWIAIGTAALALVTPLRAPRGRRSAALALALACWRVIAAVRRWH